MAKIIRSYRISPEVDTLLKAEAERLSDEHGKKVSEADVIEIAVVAWLSKGDGNTLEPDRNTPDRRTLAEAAMREAEAAPTREPIKVNPKAETVAQRRAREAKEHAEKLAECDVTARMTGRDDIEYDLENVPRQSVLNVAKRYAAPQPAPRYEIKPRESTPLVRPHGGTESKRRRDQA